MAWAGGGFVAAKTEHGIRTDEIGRLDDELTEELGGAHVQRSSRVGGFFPNLGGHVDGVLVATVLVLLIGIHNLPTTSRAVVWWLAILMNEYFSDSIRTRFQRVKMRCKLELVWLFNAEGRQNRISRRTIPAEYFRWAAGF